eukprot:1463734-Pyramimonas_sp.AAC.1
MVLGHTCCRFPRRPGSSSQGADFTAASTSVHWSVAHVGSRPGVQVSEATWPSLFCPRFPPLSRRSGERYGLTCPLSCHLAALPQP